MATKKKTRPIRALVLKRVLFDYRVPQSLLASKIQLATSTLSDIINYDAWPQNKPEDEIKSAVIAYLRSISVPRETLLTIWNVTKEDTSTFVHRGMGTPRTLCPPSEIAPPKPKDDTLPENAMLSQKAKQHFRLIDDPFSDDIQGTDDIFWSTDAQYVRTAMYQTAKRGGFIAVVGESGAGKTTLRKDLFERISKEPTIRIVFPRIIDKRRVTASSICDAILADLDVRKIRNTLEGKARQIEQLLSQSARVGNTHVIFIEEAHDLPVDVLKFLKRFLEIEDGFKKLISVILIGQPELRNTLNEQLHPELREVSRRCEIIELMPLTTNVKDYLALKLKRVQRSLDDLFDKGAIEAIRARLSIHKGHSRAAVNMAYPLIVNNCVTTALNLCVELGQPKVTAELIKDL